MAGLLSPAQIEQGIKTGILAEDLRTGVIQPLASITRQSQDGLLFGDWYFNRHTLECRDIDIVDTLHAIVSYQNDVQMSSSLHALCREKVM